MLYIVSKRDWASDIQLSGLPGIYLSSIHLERFDCITIINNKLHTKAAKGMKYKSQLFSIVTFCL